MARDKERKRQTDRAYYARNKAARLRAVKYNEDGTIRQAYLDRLEEWKERRKTHRKVVRTEIIKLLGGKCVRCGWNDPRALCIDHIKGGGTRERKSFKDLYAYYRAILARQGAGCQLLCCNHNAIKRIEEKEHRKPKR